MSVFRLAAGAFDPRDDLIGVFGSDIGAGIGELGSGEVPIALTVTGDAVAVWGEAFAWFPGEFGAIPEIVGQVGGGG